jgi:DNA primase
MLIRTAHEPQNGARGRRWQFNDRHSTFNIFLDPRLRRRGRARARRHRGGRGRDTLASSAQGKTFRGPCPLHGGEGPNFSVDPAKGIYKCFVCGEGGDGLQLPHEAARGSTFLDAVRSGGRAAGGGDPGGAAQGPAAEDRPQRPVLYEINASTPPKWFRRAAPRRARRGEGARVPRAAGDRGGGGGGALRGRLGAGGVRRSSGTAARKHGIPTDDLLLSLGLVKEAKKTGREPYDAFRGRVVFPIEDMGGRVLGFGGRVIGRWRSTSPSTSTPRRARSTTRAHVLYGLRWSRGAIRRAEVALVVEGYMDYVSLAAHGVENVVAPLGTALTAEQAALVALRLARNPPLRQRHRRPQGDLPLRRRAAARGHGGAGRDAAGGRGPGLAGARPAAPTRSAAT